MAVSVCVSLLLMLVTPAQSGDAAAFGAKQGKVFPLRKSRRGYPKKMYRSKKQRNTSPVCCNFQEPVFSGMERLPLDFLPSANQCNTHFAKYDGGLSSDLAKVFGRAGDTTSNSSCFAKTVVINPSEYGFGSMMHSLVKPAWKGAAEKFSIEFNKLDVW